MCTVIALFDVNPDVPLVVAANRDEFYARPWAPPARLSSAPRVYGGQDLVKKGTWLGVDEAGFCVAVTNQRTFGPADDTKRSRGQLALDALLTGSVDAALTRLAHEDAREYNPFNMLLGDANALYVVYARSDAQVTIEKLPRGVYVLNNDSIGSRDFPKANRARDLVAANAHAPWDALAQNLVTVLGDHELPPLDEIPEPPPHSPLSREVLRTLQAQCVHTPHYGTTSSTVLALTPGRVHDYRFAKGPPCVTRFDSVMDIIGS